MTTKHTPAPWALEPATRGSQIWAYLFGDESDERRKEGRRKWIATIKMRDDECEAEANADLLLAAPKLLEACCEMVAEWEGVDEHDSPGIQMARAAIAAARGGS